MRAPHFFADFTADMNRLFFEKGNPEARGRRCVMLANIAASISGNLTGGTFYTGFLLGNDISMTDIGFITALPYLASLLTLFTPVILGRFKQRRWVLAATRFLYFFVTAVGLALVPVFVHDKAAKVFWFGVIVFVGNALNYLFVSGYTDWHLNFLTHDVRAGFFAVQQFTNNLTGCGTAVLAGMLADSLADSPHQMTILVVLRYVGLLFGMLDVLFFSLPKEYPYPRAENKTGAFLNVLVLPLKHKRFAATAGMNCLYTLINNLPAGVSSAYLLSVVGASYLQINLINVLYCVVVLLLSGFWQRKIRQLGWISVFGLAYLLITPTQAMYMFLNPGNVLWLYTLLRLLQHGIGVGQNIAAANLPYLHMPAEERSSYTAFSTLTVNLTAWLSITLGTWFVDLVGDFRLSLGMIAFDGVQLLYGAVTVFCFLTFLLAHFAAPKLEPHYD